MMAYHTAAADEVVPVQNGSETSTHKSIHSTCPVEFGYTSVTE